MGFDNSFNSFSKFTVRLREVMRRVEESTPTDVSSCTEVKSEPPYVGCYEARNEKEFDGLALELFGLQFEHNKPYRRFCEARGVLPGSLEGWKEIPAMPTSAFKELELTCLPLEQRTKVFHSSGTTQHRPSRHFHSAESLEIYEEACWRSFETNVISKEIRDRKQESRGGGRWSVISDQGTETELVILTPGAEEARHSSLVHMFETVRRRMGAVESVFVGRTGADGSWRIDFGPAIEALKTERPVLVLGTAFSFVHLLDYFGELDLRFKLAAGSRVMETGGYKGRSRSLPKKELHRLITRRLGVQESEIICEYGMSELSSQAYNKVTGDTWQMTNGGGLRTRVEGQGRRQFSFPPWARVQIISPENGREVAMG